MTDKLWNSELFEKYCYADATAQRAGQRRLLDYLNENWPLSRYLAQRSQWEQALANQAAGRDLLQNATLSYPAVLPPSVNFSLAAFNDCAIMLTAGGDGERLRQSLLAAGRSPDSLRDFTKATFPLEENTPAASPLGYNLLFCRALGRALGRKIPVIVTMGPAGSDNARIIPEYLKLFDPEFLEIMTVSQGCRLHLTSSGQLVLLGDPDLHAATNPDETGGPFMAIKPLLPELAKKGVEKILALQGTTICQPQLVSSLASALHEHDVVGVGIRRDQFSAADPFGTFVSYHTAAGDGTTIVEAHNRTSAMLELNHPHFGYLPYNTGMYGFKTAVLRDAALPDFICPPKNICPELSPSGKVGYAAIDLLGLGHRVAVCLTPAGSFAALKGVNDVPALKEQAVKMLDFLPYID